MGYEVSHPSNKDGMLIRFLDDETDMKKLEENVRAIEQDGLVWGASTLVAVGYGIKKLQINLVVEDDKVSTDELQQRIEEDEDHVQSTDVVRIPFKSSSFTVANRFQACYAKIVGYWLTFYSFSITIWSIFHDSRSGLVMTHHGFGDELWI